MYNSWYYVKEFAKNLNREISGAVFQTPFTYKKNELYIPFFGDSEYQCFHLVIKAPVPYMMLENNIPRQKKVVKLFKKINGCVIEKVLFHRDDRQILIVMNDMFLMINGYGINGNIFLLDSDFELLESFKNRKNVLIPDLDDFVENEPMIKETNWIENFRDNSDKSLFALLKLLPYKFFSENLRNEICFRMGIEPRELVYNLDDFQKSELIRIISQLLYDIQNPGYYFYNMESPVMSFTKMDHLETEGVELNNFFELQRSFISNSFRDFNFTNRKKSLMGKIRKYFEYIERKLTKSRKALVDLPDSAVYREYGELILINVSQIRRGQKELITTSMSGYGYSIPLDPKIPAAKNADHYFKKASKAEKSKVELGSTIESLAVEKDKIQKLIFDLEEIETINHLREIEQEIPAEIIQQTLRGESNVRVPYKKYIFDGWEILVGKSSKDNDELTFKVASKLDFWLHASKVAGSHVIVKNPRKMDSLPGHVLKYAASVAAFFSKNKHSGVVPVNYTIKKYVVKRRKMAPGQVFINFEKTVIVEPIDPAGK